MEFCKVPEISVGYTYMIFAIKYFLLAYLKKMAIPCRPVARS